MKIIVCIKQVPETQEVRLDPVTHTLKREGIAAIINPFDLYALEEGLQGQGRPRRHGDAPDHGAAPGRGGAAGGPGLSGPTPRCF